jgi:hypothetical protein
MDGSYISALHTYAAANYSAQTASVINIAPPFAGPGTEYVNPDGDGSLIWDIPAGTTGSSGIGLGLFGKVNVGPTQTLYLDGSIAGSNNAGVEVGQNGTLKGSGTAERYINVDAGGTISPGHSPGCLTTNNLLVNGTYQAEIDGIQPCTGYGLTAVDVTGGTLNVTIDPGFVPAVGNSFTIIDNKSADPVTGNFVGMPEGATFTNQGVTYRITYKGGDGNDVVLTVTNVDLSLLKASAVPKVPNTGFKLVAAHPMISFGITALCATILVYISRRINKVAASN